MMYPFMTLNDNTEIVHSEMHEDGRVLVHIEKPDEKVYFCTNENDPLEPIHVHIAKGSPVANATKVWITESRKCLLCNNNY